MKSVTLIICPKGKEEWELIETLHTNFEMREQMIKDFAINLFQQLIKNNESEKQASGFVKNLATKILDNVQLSIQNIHVRLENYEHFNNKFAMGMTLKEITVHTTNSSWEKEFYDRTRVENQDKPVFKVLNILKFGAYWITNNDEFFARDYPRDEDEDLSLKAMSLLFPPGSELIEAYKDFYLLQPIYLQMKLKQLVSSAQLAKEAEFSISLDIDNFSIYLQKLQYDNIIRLIELFTDYTTYQYSYQQTRKYNYLRPFHDAPLRDKLRFAYKCIKMELKQQKTCFNMFQLSEQRKLEYAEEYKKQVSRVIAEEILKTLEKEEKQVFQKIVNEIEVLNESQDRQYQYIVMASEQELLKAWTTELITNVFVEKFKAEILAQQNSAQSQSQGSYGIYSMVSSSLGGFSSWLVGGQNSENIVQEEQKIVEETKHANDSDDEFYDAYDDQTMIKEPKLKSQDSIIKEEIDQIRDQLMTTFGKTHQISLEKEIQISPVKNLHQKLKEGGNKLSHSEEQESETIPEVYGKFTLKKFSIALVNNNKQSEGLEIFSQDFTIEFNKFDSDSESSPFAFSIIAKNEQFGVNQLIRIDNLIYRTPIVQREQNRTYTLGTFLNAQNIKNYQTVVKLVQGNPNCRNKSKNYFDFDLQVAFQPVRIIYQVVPINKLFKFLKVENFKDELRLQAIQKLENLKQSVNISDVLKTKKKNRLEIDIASPILVIPFMRNNDLNSQIWLFNMGNIQIQNYDEEFGPSLPELSLKGYKNFKVQISQIMMKYAKSYKSWVDECRVRPLQSQQAQSNQITSVIEEFRLQFVLSLVKAKNKKQADIIFLNQIGGKAAKKSDFLLQGSMSDLNINFTPHIYNNICNIDKLLTFDENSTIQTFEHQLVNEKAQVIKNATKIGQLNYTYNLQGQWQKCFGVISGAYIYLYEQQQDEQHKDYFYINDCQIEIKQGSTVNNFTKLSNSMEQDIYLQFTSTEIESKWLKDIQDKVAELSSDKNIFQKKQKQDSSQSSDLLFNQTIAFDANQIKQQPADDNQMEFHFNIQKISLKISVENNPQEFDIGIFQTYKGQTTNFEENPFKNFEKLLVDNQQWQTEIKVDGIKFSLVKRSLDQEMTVILSQLSIKDDNNERFPDLIKSQLSDTTKAFIEINIQKQDRTYSDYNGIDMNVDLAFGMLQVNWHPKTLNRLIRFFRYMKLQQQVVDQEKEKFIYDITKQQNSFHRQKTEINGKTTDEIIKNSDQIDNCVNHPEKFMKVKCELQKLVITLIHPINYTYPIATLWLSGFKMLYIQNFDHDEMTGSISDLRMFDNTNYPLTIDPNQIYSVGQTYPNHEILGPRQDIKAQEIISFEIIMFSKPLNNDCPHQLDNYDKNVNLNLSSIRFQFMNEWIMRINDYFFNQFLAGLSDANPYQQLIDQTLNDLKAKHVFQHCQSSIPPQQLKKGNTLTENDFKQLKHQVSFDNVSLKSENKSFQRQSTITHHHHHHHHQHHHLESQSSSFGRPANKQDFDLEQSKSCPNMNVNLNRPLIVIKDRPYLKNEVEIDLGKIKVTSKTEEVLGRWKSNDTKYVWVTNFIIEMNDMGIKQNQEFEIASPFNMKVNFEKMNYSPHLEDSYTSHGIDFTDLDISQKISISFSPLIMHLKQDTYTYLLRCNDLNVNYTDSLAKYFQLAIWNNGEDTQKYLKQEQIMVKKFKNKDVFKMKVDLHFPSLGLQLHNKDNAFLAELVFWDVNLDFLKFIDYRKDIILGSHTFFILHKPSQKEANPNLKQVAIAPVNSKNIIMTDKGFYNFEQKISAVQSSSPQKRHKIVKKLQKKNFLVNVRMEPDGAKNIHVKIEKLKIIIKPHIFFTIQEIFMYGMPQYKDDRDKPNYYDSDWGNSPKMELGCQIMQSLLCFENESNLTKTIACQGNTSFTMIREKMNQIKSRLLEIQQEASQDDIKTLKRSNSIVQNSAIDSSSTFKIMQVSVSDLCPFFCHSSDLDGKKFNQVRKREMMSPFTLYFNKSDIIELTTLNDGLYAKSPYKLVFKTYSKIEANLERTLLKLSFNDIKILKGIADHMAIMLTEEYERLIKEGGDSALGHGGDLRLVLQATQSSNNTATQKEINENPQPQFGLGGLNLRLANCPKEDEQTHQHIGDIVEDEEDSIRTDSDEEDDDNQFFEDQFKREEHRLQALANLQLLKRTTEAVVKSGKQLRNIENITTSMRRTSIAFNLIKESYNKRNQDYSGDNIHDEEMISLYERVQHEHSKFGSATKKKSPSYEASPEDPKRQSPQIGSIDEENCEDEIDEGDRTVVFSNLGTIMKKEPHIASKNIAEEKEKTIVNFIKTDALIQFQHISEEKGVNQYQIVSYGLKILIINDSQQNFFPVLGISLSEFHYSFDQGETAKVGETQFSSAINYYNPEAGEWEPFIETVRVHFNISEVNNKKIFLCDLPTNFNMNITQKLVQNLSNTYKSWLRSIETQEAKKAITAKTLTHNESEEEASLKDEDDESYTAGDRGGTQKPRKMSISSFSSRSMSRQQRAAPEDEEEDDENGGVEEEDVVTPYSICNQTNVKLLVKRLNYQEFSSNLKSDKHQKNQPRQQTHGISNQQNQSKLNRVYVILPEQTIDYAVDYELQVKQQISMYNSHQFSGQHGEFIKILFEDVQDQNVANTGLTIPLSNVNLNQVGCKKHYFRDDEAKENSEFYVYGVSQVNMKKVLTVRSQYLLVNQTFYPYEVHLRFKTSSIVKTLQPGDRMPIPNNYNQCKFQIRISPEDSGSAMKIESMQQSFRLQKRENEDGIPLSDIVGKDLANFQFACRSWSDMLIVNSLKTKLPLNKTTFLRHGQTFTIIKKETATFADTYDIVLRPPLLLKNCLPMPVTIEYEDSNQKYDSFILQKQEEKHIFVFNLQSQVEIYITIEGFRKSKIILDCSIDKELEIKTSIVDMQGRELDIQIATSSKVAGKKALFYAKSMVINNTEQKLAFFYSQPNEKEIKMKGAFKDAVAGQTIPFFVLNKLCLLSEKQEIFATLEGPVPSSVSNPINIFNPGCKDHIMLALDKKLFEFSYKTEIFLASKDEYAYTKITTITPLYVIINNTSGQLRVAQEGAEDASSTIEIKERMAFNWSDFKKDRMVALQSEGYRWTSGFSLSEVGAICLQTRSTSISLAEDIMIASSQARETKIFRIDRRLNKNTMYILIQEETMTQPTYMIENFSKIFSIRYWQHGSSADQNSDQLGCGESNIFGWVNHYEDHILDVQINNETFAFQIDKLNGEEKLTRQYNQEDQLQIHVCTFTDGFTKVIRFSDQQSNYLAQLTGKQDGIIEDENLIPQQLTEVYLKQFTLSVIGQGQELFSLYLQGIKVKLEDTDKARKIDFKIGYLQIDNQSENDPIYPVLLKPKYLKPDPTITSSRSTDLDDPAVTKGKRHDPSQFNKNSVFELNLEFRKNIPNVTYFELIQYIIQPFQVKLELSHLLTISKFLSLIGEISNQKLTWMHQIFEGDEEEDTQDKGSAKKMKKVEEEDDPEFLKQALSRGLKTKFASLLAPKQHISQRQISGQLIQVRPIGNSPKRIASLKKQKTLQQKIRGAHQDGAGDALNQDDIRVHKEDWKEEELIVASNRIYIKEYLSSPVDLEISLINRVALDQEEGGDIFKTISSLGLLISSFDQAPINLNALIIRNIFGDKNDVMDQIKKHHTEKLVSNVLKFIGASNLLGNPVNFVNSLGTGIQDFYYQPKQGFMAGPLEGGIGIIKGTSSLLTNTFVGTITSASKIASSVSKGLLVLSNDNEYIYQRDVDTIKNKPKNVLQGLNLGLKSAINSVGSGITGVVSKPIEESKKGGFLGFLKGTAKGVSGLVVKPISGTLDFFSITAEGIKNTTKNNEELALDKRLRNPRPFYENEQTIREYDEFHAFWVDLVPKLQRDIQASYFYEACMLESTDTNWSVLFLTQNQISQIISEQKQTSKKSPKQQKISVKWVFNTSDIQYVDLLDERRLSISLKNECINIQIGDQSVAERIRSKIEKIIKNK